MFQSHLYGIERASGSTTRTTGTSFNRTFMELKDDRIRRLNNTRTFQSHLYGIESLPRWRNLLKRQRFNRTFMELKVSGASGTADLCLFQSHLYGIESRLDTLKTRVGYVSIAPLWN